MPNQMTSNRPYLLRAMYDWISDNGLTVHLLVNALYPGVSVPQDYVEDGQIVLNITPGAVQHLHMDLEWVSFAARFRGVAREVDVPVEAVMAIFAKENGQGMAFETQQPPEPPTPPKSGPPKKAKGKSGKKDDKGGGRGHLKVVK